MKIKTAMVMGGLSLYESSSWATAFAGSSHEWLVDGGMGGRYLDALTLLQWRKSATRGAGTRTVASSISKPE